MTELFYGLSRDDMLNPSNVDEWDEDRFEAEAEFQDFLKMVVLEPESAQSIAQAALVLLEVWYGQPNPQYPDPDDIDNAWMTPAKALHAALIWDRG